MYKFILCALTFIFGMMSHMNTYAAAKTLPEIYVNFVFATDHKNAQAFDTREQAVKEVNILNRYFVTEKGKPIFHFKLKKYMSFKEFSEAECKFLDLLSRKQSVKSKEAATAFNQCFPHEPRTIYMFVYDAYSPKKGWADITSWGFNNQGHPFILIDWERLNYNKQAAVPHEMGHAFGLKHECAPKATIKDSTNIMTSADCGLGSGGKRNIGFNTQQLKTIQQKFLGLKR